MSTELAQDIDSRSYYGSDEKLRAFQEYSVAYSGGESSTSSGVWEEYRYDPLGRRVMVITRRPAELCDGPGPACLSSVTRFVWSGDQLLWEMKSVEGTGTYPDEAGGGVSYTHAGGIDRPLAIWKSNVGTIVTHQNWRGQFARGTFGVGPKAGQRSDCASYPPSNGCIPVAWPGWSTTAWHEGVGSQQTTGYGHYWMGSLASEMRDASGQMYMRNRYYDPQTGQFTQPDPIGLAGGLNSYGFAAGDPVSYSDPYGLCPDPNNPLCTMNPWEMFRNSLGLSNVPMHDNSSTSALLYVSAGADAGIHTATVRNDQYRNQPQLEGAATFPSAGLGVAAGVEFARANPDQLQFTIAIGLNKRTGVSVTIIEGPGGPAVGAVEVKAGVSTPTSPITISVKGQKIEPLQNQFYCGKVGC